MHSNIVAQWATWGPSDCCFSGIHKAFNTMLFYCWVIVTHCRSTLNQHWSTFRVTWTAGHSPHVGLMLLKRLYYWTNFKKTFVNPLTIWALHILKMLHEGQIRRILVAFDLNTTNYLVLYSPWTQSPRCALW